MGELQSLKTVFAQIFNAQDRARRRVGYPIRNMTPAANAVGTLVVSVTGGAYVHNSNASETSFAGGTTTLAAANSSHPRVDIIYMSSLAALANTTGTPASVNPVPASWPVGACPLAIAFVPAGAVDFTTGGYVLDVTAYNQPGGTPSLGLSTAAAGGTAQTFVRTDDTVAIFDTNVPTNASAGDSASTGVAAFAARRDHRHGLPNFTEVMLDRVLTPVSVATSVSTNIYSYTVSAGALGTNRTMRLTLFGDRFHNAAGGQVFGFSLKYGTQTVIAAGGVGMAVTAGANRVPWWFEAEIQALNSASLQSVVGRTEYVSAGAIAASIFQEVNTGMVEGFNTASQDSTTPLALVVTVSLSSTNASLDVVLRGGTLTLL